MRGMLDIKFGKMELLHSYQKHGLNKSKILEALETGIKDIVVGKQSNKLIYTFDYTTIVLDKDNNFLTAYKTSEQQYNTKKIKSLNGGK
nr:MAG TPA: Colicin D [Caudoviricetes sp.]